MNASVQKAVPALAPSTFSPASWWSPAGSPCLRYLPHNPFPISSVMFCLHACHCGLPWDLNHGSLPVLPFSALSLTFPTEIFVTFTMTYSVSDFPTQLWAWGGQGPRWSQHTVGVQHTHAEGTKAWISLHSPSGTQACVPNRDECYVHLPMRERRLCVCVCVPGSRTDTLSASLAPVTLTPNPGAHWGQFFSPLETA